MTIDNSKKTIFIPFASCQEYYLEHTIKSAIANAEFPERIYFGVFNQISNKKYSLLDNNLFKDNENIVYAELMCQHPMGVGAARMNASLLSTMNHDFMFQTDAHTIFTKNWDSILIEAYNTVKERENTDKIVFSGMQAGQFICDPSNREVINVTHPNIGKVSSDIFYNNNFHENKNLKIGKTKFIKPDPNSIPRSDYDDSPEKEQYEEVFAIVATFLFAPYSIIRDVMHDPQDPYSGDQTNYSLRLISRGYRIFTPKYPPMLSMGKASDESGGRIDDEYDWWSENNFKHDHLRFILITSFDNYNDIVSGKYLGYWGAPDIESLQYAKNKMKINDL